jgi:hypothetical protein
MRELKQARALATRSRIVGEAARHFALKGYHDVYDAVPRRVSEEEKEMRWVN